MTTASRDTSGTVNSTKSPIAATEEGWWSRAYTRPNRFGVVFAALWAWLRVDERVCTRDDDGDMT